MDAPELFLDDPQTGPEAPRWREVWHERAAWQPVLVAAALLLALALGLSHLRDQTLRAEQRTLSTLAAALAEQADSALAASQTAMQATVEELSNGAWLDNDELAVPILRTRAATLPWVRQLLIVGVDGRVLQAAVNRAAWPNLIGAAYVRAALAAPAGSAHLGPPERWPGEDDRVLPMAMPWHAPNGRVLGAVVLAATPGMLTSGFTQTRPTADAALHLVQQSGERWLSDPPESQAWPQAAATPDDVLVVSQALQRAPLTMVLTRERGAVLHDWWAQVRLLGVIAVAVLLATAGLALRHARELRWRELSQQRLQRQQARAARAFHAAREGLWEWDPAARRHFLSPRMRELLGFEPDADISTDGPLAWADRVPAHESERLAQALEALNEPGTTEFSVTLKVTPPGMPPRQLRVRGQALPLAIPGAPVLAGTAYDVTDEVALDEQLQRARRLEALGTLAGGVAHDFNNVLAVIQGHAERAHDLSPAASPVRQHLARIQDATRRGKTLAERLTASGQQAGARRRLFAPRALLEEAWALATDVLSPDAHAALDAGDPHWQIEGDPVAFFEACLNLLRNAAQAVAHGGHLRAQLALETVAQERVLWHGRLSPGTWVKLVVSDDGPGIAPEHQPFLLDPFFTTRAGHGGTGLGMTVVHNTLRDAGGALDLHTGPGLGTRFELYVPAQGLLRDDTVETESLGHGQVVLAVDDEPALAELLEERLASLGYEPRVFADPDEAWAAFQAEPTLFDALITDQKMGTVDGLTLVQRCHALAPQLPCLVLTAYGGIDFEQQATEAGVRQVLQKPLDTAALGRALKQVFGPGGPSPAPAAEGV